MRTSGWARATSFALAGSLALGAAGQMGCSRSEARHKTQPVEGTIVEAGQPVSGALVAFHPVTPIDDKHVPSTAQTDGAGKFRLTTYQKDDGVPPGAYKVTVQRYVAVDAGQGMEPGPNTLSPKLSTPQSTDVQIEVAAGTSVLSPIDVKRDAGAQTTPGVIGYGE